MTRVLVTLLVVCCSYAVGTAQDIPAPKGCGYDHYVHSLNRQHPGFKAAVDNVFGRVKLRSPEDDLAVYTIPVVVHVVWADESENLADSLINQVIDVLNEDYRRMNADADLIRDEFLDVVGDPSIEFELAGVERVQTDTTFSMNILANSLPDNVKTSEGGGSDAWDTNSYLNIWVCNIQGGALLGYAYPPAGLDNWPDGVAAPQPELDGVVIHYEVFRRTGTYTASGLLGLGEQTIPFAAAPSPMRWVTTSACATSGATVYFQSSAFPIAMKTTASATPLTREPPASLFAIRSKIVAAAATKATCPTCSKIIWTTPPRTVSTVSPMARSPS